MNEFWSDARVEFLEPIDANNGVEIWVGKRFVFADVSNVADVSECDWVDGLQDHLIGRKAVVSLNQSVPCTLNKIKVTPEPIPELVLASITTDRKIYQTKRDAIHLFVASPRQKSSKLTVMLSEGGQVYDESTIELDPFGLGYLELTDLPAGNYTAAINEGSDGKWRRANDVNCEFTVCDFQLVPFVVKLDSFAIKEQLDGKDQERLYATLHLSRLGTPFTGKAHFELLSGDQSLGKKTTEVNQGVTELKFPVHGDSELIIQIQLEKYPDLTASVRLPSSDINQRRKQMFSTIGSVVQGSLVPTGNSSEVRGIHFSEYGIDVQPVHLVSKGDGKIEFDCYASVENLVVQCIPISTCGLENKGCSKQFGNVPIAHSVSLTSKAAVNLVGIGCFVNGEPWEAWGFAITNSDTKIEITTPKENENHDGNRLTIRSPRSAKAHVVVRDARLTSGNSSQSIFAEQMTEFVRKQLSCYSIKPPQKIAELQPITMKLVSDGLISIEQLQDAQNLARQTSGNTSDALLKLGYVRNTELCKAWSNLLGFPYVELRDLEIHEDVVELMPESVARENCVFPIGYSRNELIVAAHDPSDMDTIEKLRFILNRSVSIHVATREQIVEAINRFYGQIEGESADSILQEFCDTSVDFTDTIELHNRQDSLLPEEIESKQDSILPENSATIFAGLVEFSDGLVDIELEGLQANREYEVTVYAVSGIAGFDWVQCKTRFNANRFPYAEFNLPDQLHADDGAQGRLMFGTRSGQSHVIVELPNGKTIEKEFNSKNQFQEITFTASQGRFAATVTDVKNEQTIAVEHFVSNPESYSVYSRRMRILQPGDSFKITPDASINRLEWIQHADNPAKELAFEICDYDHCCCEQTAAKIRAATHLYLLGNPESEDRFLASKSIVQGINRLSGMFVGPGKFRSYPGLSAVALDHWSALVCLHLKFLHLFSNEYIQCPELNKAIQAGLRMSSYQPIDVETIASPVQSYLAFRFSRNKRKRAAAFRYLANMLKPLEKLPNRVEARARNAYIASAFIQSGKAEFITKGISLANQIMNQPNARGRFYSTLDSTAALTMLTELKSLGCGTAGAIRIDGELVQRTNEGMLDSEIRTLEAVDLPIMLRYQQKKQIRWSDFANNVPMTVTTKSNDRHESTFATGDKFDLNVTLKNGYKFGDHVLIYLPDSVTYLAHGAQVKRLNLDFEGHSEISVPLVVTGESRNRFGEIAPHHYAVCVRNMYDEDRVGQSGWLKINCLDG